MDKQQKNAIKVEFIVQKRDRTDFNDEQSTELGNRISSMVKQMGYEILLPSEVDIDEPDTDKGE